MSIQTGKQIKYLVIMIDPTWDNINITQIWVADYEAAYIGLKKSYL